MKNIKVAGQILLTALIGHVLAVTAITNSADTGVLNLNEIQDGARRDKAVKYKDGVGAETQEKRSLFKPDMDRRGSFYPSASSHSNTGFNLGSGFNVGGTGHGGPNYHTSGNGYSYGAPNVGYPPVIYGGSYPAPGGSSSGAGGFGHSGHAGAGGFGLVPATPGAGGYNKVMALKGLLIPIAGVALLGAAAVLAKSNPVLLQLGVISGKKKRSVLVEDVYPVNPYVRPEYRHI